MEKYLETAKLAAQEARKIHSFYYKKIVQTQNKQDSSLVSRADKESEAAIREIFRKHTPEFGLLGEEEGFEGASLSQTQGRWIFDPLDGTTNYVHGYPFFCTSIALEIQGEIVVGLVDSYALKKTYYAVKGGGAFYLDEDGTRSLHVSQTSSIEDSLVATGFSTYGGAELDKQIEIFKNMVQKARGVRRSGSAALELCLLAEGCLDGFWEIGLKEWDTAAGFLIIQESGGAVTDLEGRDFSLKASGIVASNTKIHKDLLRSL